LTQQADICSLTVRPKANLYFDIDKTVKVRNIKLDNAGTKLTLKAGQTVQLAKNGTRGWSGTAAAYDTIISSSHGNKARVSLSAIKEDSATYEEDIAYQGFTKYDTIRGTNGGNDSNVVFKTTIAPIANYLTPSQTVITSVSPATGDIAGGERDTFTGQEFFAPCSSKVGGVWYALTVLDSTKAWFLRPAHAAGVISDTIKNADGLVGVLANSYTYTSSGTVTTPAQQRGPFDNYRNPAYRKQPFRNEPFRHSAYR
jgi:hypothetical protein